MVHSGQLEWRLAAALLAAGLAACAGARAGGPAVAHDPCAVDAPLVSTPWVDGPQAAVPWETAQPSDAAGGERPETVRPIVVALTGPVDPAHAPIPRTDAERLVFAQLYETLVRVTCEGRVEPRLAVSWKEEEGGRRWRFTLREARDWEGTPVTAADVGSSWLAARQALGREPAGGPWPPVRRVAAADARTVVVELEASATVALFAHPALGVRTAARASGWPTGTGPYRPPPDGRVAAGAEDRLLLSPMRGVPPLELRLLSGNPRDALEAGMDLVVTSDPGLIEYGAAGSFHDAALPWDRTYVLVAPAAGRGEGPESLPVGRPPEPARVDLARNVVGGGARPAAGWVESFEQCGLRGGSAAPPGEIRIVYPIGDGPARSLAERLVALALAAGRSDGAPGAASWLAEAVPGLVASAGPVRAHGLASTDFAASLRAGDEAAYLVPLERGPLAPGGVEPCTAARRLAARAPWLAHPVGPAPEASRPAPAVAPRQDASAPRPAVVPLVDTRATLLLRQGLRGVVVDGDGTLRLEGIRREPAGIP